MADATININLKKDKARAAADAFRRDMDSLNKGMAADSAAARKAEVDAVKAANREKVEAAKAAAKVEAEAAKEKAAAVREAAKAEAAANKEKAAEAKAATKAEVDAVKAASKEKAAAAKESAKAEAAANKEKAAAAREAARPERELRAASLTDEQAQHRAKVQLARAASKDKVAALTETTRRERELRGVSLTADQVNHRAKVELTRRASQDQVDAMVEANTKGKLSFGDVTSAIGTTVAAVAPLISALKLVQAAYDEVGERQRKFGEKSLGKLEGQAQVAALMGVPQDKKFAINQAEVGRRTFQNTEELNRGQIAFRGPTIIGTETYGKASVVLRPAQLDRPCLRRQARTSASPVASDCSAYRNVVWRFLCPSRFRIVARLTPPLTISVACVCRNWWRVHGTSAREQYRAHRS